VSSHEREAPSTSVLVELHVELIGCRDASAGVPGRRLLSRVDADSVLLGESRRAEAPEQESGVPVAHGDLAA